MLQGATNQALDGGRGKQNMHRRTQSCRFFNLHFLGTVDRLWMALIENNKSDRGIGRDTGHLENWNGGRLKFMTLACMESFHIISPLRRFPFLPLCRRQEVQHLRRELNDSLRSIRSSDGVCLSIAFTQDIANLCNLMYIYIHLEVKLPAIWTDGKAEAGRVREEKSRREKIR